MSEWVLPAVVGSVALVLLSPSRSLRRCELFRCSGPGRKTSSKKPTTTPGWRRILRAASDMNRNNFQLVMLAYTLNCWLLLFRRHCHPESAAHHRAGRWNGFVFCSWRPRSGSSMPAERASANQVVLRHQREGPVQDGRCWIGCRAIAPPGYVLIAIVRKRLGAGSAESLGALRIEFYMHSQPLRYSKKCPFYEPTFVQPGLRAAQTGRETAENTTSQITELTLLPLPPTNLIRRWLRRICAFNSGQQ